MLILFYCFDNRFINLDKSYIIAKYSVHISIIYILYFGFENVHLFSFKRIEINNIVDIIYLFLLVNALIRRVPGNADCKRPFESVRSFVYNIRLVCL